MNIGEAAPAREGGVAAADQAPAEPTAEPTAEGTAQAAPSSGAAEEKPKTLLQALGDQSNRDVAQQFAAFSGALAFLPILGLFASECLLRSMVSDSNRRWMYSAIVAVLLVNLVLGAFVVHCFLEGFPDPAAAEVAAAKGSKGVSASEKDEVKEDKKEK